MVGQGFEQGAIAEAGIQPDRAVNTSMANRSRLRQMTATDTAGG
jgi:hypothetical protein